MKRATLKDISKMLGVSPSTVSRGLHNHPDISEELKEKIKQVSELVHYSPNLTAINLKSKSTKTIGLIIPSICKFFIPNIINGISSVLEQNGYKLVILLTNDNLQKEIEQVKMCCYSQMDGIIISLSNQTTNLNHLTIADELEIPIVLFDKVIEQNKYITLKINDVNAAFVCTNYLLSKNCKNIVGVFGNKNLEISHRRLIGFNNALSNCKNTKSNNIFANSMQDAKEQLLKLYKKNKLIDGIFCMSDEVLSGTSAALYKSNLLNKIQLICISDGELIQYHTPPIPYLLHDGNLMGKQSANVMLDNIKNKNKFSVLALELDTNLITF